MPSEYPDNFSVQKCCCQCSLKNLQESNIFLSKFGNYITTKDCWAYVLHPNEQPNKTSLLNSPQKANFARQTQEQTKQLLEQLKQNPLSQSHLRHGPIVSTNSRRGYCEQNRNQINNSETKNFSAHLGQ